MNYAINNHLAHVMVLWQMQRFMCYFTVFAMFHFVFDVNFEVQALGGLFSEGQFKGGFFFALRVWRAYTWMGLYSDFSGILRAFVVRYPGLDTLLAEAIPLCFSALYYHSLRGFGCSRFVLVVSVPRKRPLQTAVWDSC